MVKPLFIGATALLLLTGGPAWADWRSFISGARAILPPRFVPRAPPRPFLAETMARVPARAGWALPLLDRHLSQAEKDAGIASELLDAVARIEPMYDPTRLDGPDSAPVFGVSSGTASMDNVFADRWRMASPDANINRTARYVASTWQNAGALPCSSFTKSRAHGYAEPMLTELSADDCAALLQTETRDFSDPPLVPIVVARISVPVFAAPLPGSRQSSRDFWAMQRARIAAIQGKLKDRWRTHPSTAEATDAKATAFTRVGLRQ